MDDRFSVDAWHQHQIWLRVHHSRELQRSQWRTEDWELARQVADCRWEHSGGAYLWQALKGVEQAHWCHGRRRLTKTEERLARLEGIGELMRGET